MLDLLLKQMGIDPKNLKKQADDAVLEYKRIIQHIDHRFDRLERLLEVKADVALSHSTHPYNNGYQGENHD